MLSLLIKGIIDLSIWTFGYILNFNKHQLRFNKAIPIWPNIATVPKLYMHEWMLVDIYVQVTFLVMGKIGQGLGITNPTYLGDHSQLVWGLILYPLSTARESYT